MNESTESKTPPIKSFRVGQVEASIWPEEVQRGEVTIKRYTVRVQKRFRDSKTGEWRSTEWYHANELPKLALAVSKAFEFAALHESEDAPAESD